MGHLAAGLGFSPPAGLFFSNGRGDDSGVALGRVTRSGTVDRSAFFLSSALGTQTGEGAGMALALNAIRMIPKNNNFILPRSACIEPNIIMIQLSK
jgi:hypothetical protein